jgi:hypothetical protein
MPHSAAAQDTTSVVGVWKLTSLVTKEVATGKTVHPLGEGPIGYTIYTRGGHFKSVTTAANRKAPAGASPTDAERIELHKTAVFTSGTYRQEGNKVIAAAMPNGRCKVHGCKSTGPSSISATALTI